MPDPRRILLLGNSHLAALRDAHRAAPGRWPGLAPVFIGLRGPLMADLALEAGNLIARSPLAAAALRGQDRRIRPQEHDAIIVIGGALAPQTALIAARGPGAAARLANHLSHRPGPDLGRRLRAAGRPVWLVPQPRPDAAILSRRDAMARLYRRAVATAAMPAVSALLDCVASDIARSGGLGYLAQPMASRSHDILTHHHLMSGGGRLRGGPQPADDVNHANAGYGAMLLDAIAALPDQPGW